MNREILKNLLIESGFNSMNFTPESIERFDRFATKVARYVIHECAEIVEEYKDPSEPWLSGSSLTHLAIERLDKSSEESST